MAELESAVHLDLGSSDWHTVDQATIDLFADATHDRQWIHLDRERAAAGPFGATIAHGYLTLSLIPYLLHQVLTITDAKAGINYGIDRVRFTAPVRSGSRVRLHVTILGAERRSSGLSYGLRVELEIEGEDRPALVGEILFLAHGGG